MLRFAVASGVVALLSLPAVAGEISPATTITAVTVFPTGANITRTVPIELPAGPSTVIVPDLPGEIETDSIKVEGTADQAMCSDTSPGFTRCTRAARRFRCSRSGGVGPPSDRPMLHGVAPYRSASTSTPSPSSSARA